MKELTTYFFTHTTGEDQINYFSGEFGLSAYGINDVSLIDMEQGIYRIVDGQLYRIKTDLPPALVKCK
jgi:hypothetical protein